MPKRSADCTQELAHCATMADGFRAVAERLITAVTALLDARLGRRG
jgi:hypothetical protein